MMNWLSWLQVAGSLAEIGASLGMIPMLYLIWASRSLETMIRVAQALGRWPRWLPRYK